MANRFKKQLGESADSIINAGKSEIEKNKNTEIEEKSGYYEYRKIVPKNGKISARSDKYKVNLSLEEETLQKFQYMFSTEYLLKGIIDFKAYSKVAKVAIDLLYDTYYLLNQKGINIFEKELTTEQIIDEMSNL